MTSLSGLRPGVRIGRFTVVHVLPRRVRLRSGALWAPDLDSTYYQALIEALPGVKEARINTKGGSLVVVFDGKEETWTRIQGYLVTIPQEAYYSVRDRETPIKASDVAVKAAAVLLAQIFPQPLKAGLSWAASIDVLLKGLETLITRGLKVQVLDALAVSLSLIRENYFTAGTISTLLALGEYLEEHSEQRSAALLKSLLRPQAETLWVVRDGVEVNVPADEVGAGDHVVFGVGEGIAVDGTIISGEALVNQSSISGESVPVHLKEGDQVISGSVIDEGRVVVEVERAGSETSVARIGRFIDQSLRNKSKKQTKSSELADKLVPVTLGIGAASWLVTRDIRRVSSVLTVDFSCSIKLASPIAVRSGMYAAGQAGVLLKGATVLDSLADVDTLVFDKTGTLTTGHLTVTDIISTDDTPGEVVLSLAAGAEEHYDHPVARAIVREARERGLSLPPISRVDFIVAHGVSAYIDNKNILVGSYHFIVEDEGVSGANLEESARLLRNEGKSLLYVAQDGKLLGIIALRDEPRPEAAAVLTAMKEQGIKRIVVLTGDHKDTALALKRRLPQIDDVFYELKPEEKAHAVEQIKESGGYLAYVGDGVNDAPALVNAHVGVCMPRGADLAKEAAQVLLLQEDLNLLLMAREASNKTNRVIRQCFFATMISNSVTIVAALAGMPAAISALLHNLSTVGILGYAGMAASQLSLPEAGKQTHTELDA